MNRRHCAPVISLLMTKKTKNTSLPESKNPGEHRELPGYPRNPFPRRKYTQILPEIGGNSTMLNVGLNHSISSSYSNYS